MEALPLPALLRQAALTIQDSHIEIHRLVLQQQEGLSPGLALRGGPFQDPEKHRHLEKWREELANVPKLQHQFQQDQRRWHRRCDQQRREQEARESWLQDRERECQAQEERLRRSRGELDQQLQEYQQNLERLREGQRLVERARERVRAQQSLLGGWRHSRQSSLPAAFSPGSSEVRSPGLARAGSRAASSKAGSFPVILALASCVRAHTLRNRRRQKLGTFGDNTNASLSIETPLPEGLNTEPSCPSEARFVPEARAPECCFLKARPLLYSLLLDLYTALPCSGPFSS